MTGPQRHEGLLLGIDIGGTKTHLRALQPGSAARDIVVPTAQWRTRSFPEDARRLLALADQLTEGQPVGAIGIGAHGCDDDDECAAFTRAFEAITKTPVAVVNDAELMPLALGLEGQIGVVAGTGSIAVCRRPTGGMISAGGWGWVIGDEGSAAGLVREAARAVSLHVDAGGSTAEPLADALVRSLGLSFLPRLGSALAELGNAAAIGAHAKAVFDAAEAGSRLAAQVIREGGRSLAGLVGTLDARGVGARHAVAGGSVIVAQPMLWQAFAAAVKDKLGERMTPHLFDGSPVEGACRLAAIRAGAPAMPAALEH